jgi:hypothetical protein
VYKWQVLTIVDAVSATTDLKNIVSVRALAASKILKNTLMRFVRSLTNFFGIL